MLDLDEDLALRARSWVQETTLAQGLSVHVSDPVALRKIATVLGWDDPSPTDLDRGSTGSPSSELPA
jgi:hypothetical protein